MITIHPVSSAVWLLRSASIRVRSASIESVSSGALSLCLGERQSRIVKTATKPMNALELVRRQLKRQQALKEAQKATATTLCYRGNCYVKQTGA